ncbi:MAG: M16 family metallopeptidase [Cyclobacteriaceae bacterium]
MNRCSFFSLAQLGFKKYMIHFDTFQLANGLKVAVHEDTTTSLAAVNIIYNVGSRDEVESKTGFAHLFEHLMFGGSKHITDFDVELQKAGGDNNAFTCPDYTSYYCTLPAANLETAFWLESDRMLSLSFDPKVLETQRSVVIEEFKQMYLNQPYGDAMLLLRPLAYKKHPYLWPTIGKEISHIEEATMNDVRAFFGKHYHPANAVMVVGGNVKTAEVQRLAEKWFGGIAAKEVARKNIPQEEIQTENRLLEVERDVPTSSIYKSYAMPSRLSPDYHAVDLLSDILGRGSSSRLHQRLIKEKQAFGSLGSYITGSLDPGLLIVSGKVSEGVSLEKGNQLIEEEVSNLLNESITERELQKVKNQAESSLVFSKIELMDKVMEIAFGMLVGEPDLINKEMDRIQEVNVDQVQKVAKEIFEYSSTLLYQAKTK